MEEGYFLKLKYTRITDRKIPKMDKVSNIDR